MSSNTKTKKQHIVKLPKVKPEEIDKQFGFKILTPNISSMIEEKTIPTESTKITDLHNTFNQNITFDFNYKLYDENLYNGDLDCGAVYDQGNLIAIHYWKHKIIPNYTDEEFENLKKPN